MTTVIAEKPSVAQEIAKILKVNERNDGYISNADYNITWAYGHLVTLSMPDAYGYDKWDMDNLPIIPSKFKLKPIENSGVKKQLKTIKSLFEKSNCIIVATDAGREGELIYRLIAKYLRVKNKNVKRLWISDLTKESIIKGLNNLRDISKYDTIYYSAMSRACADWLVGINFTQCITLSSKKNNPISIGRVQTPTLKMITDRYYNHNNFKSEKFFTPNITVTNNVFEIKLNCKTRFKNKQEIKSLPVLMAEEVKLDVQRKEKYNYPPSLYDLTSLQKEAFNLLKYTAKDTLDIAQKLYESKKISYPRTDSKHLAENQKNDVKYLLNHLSSKIEYKNLKGLIDYENLDKSKNFNNKFITDHHAIIPTKNFNGSFEDEREKNIFILILKKTFESFSKPSIVDNLSINTKISEYEFSENLNSVRFEGWLEIKKYFLNKINITLEKDQNTSLSKYHDLKSGIFKVISLDANEGTTKAPQLFNESTILAAMENSDKYMNDNNEDVKLLKDTGLGTPATRASIIETLIQREFIYRSKNKLIPTNFGIELINSLKNSKVVSADYTGEIEFKLRQIVNGEQDLKSFMNDTKKFVTEELPNIKRAGASLQEIKTQKEIKNDFSYGKCPKCDGVIKKSKKGAYCSNFKNEKVKCNFFIYNKIASKKLSDAQIKKLLVVGETNLIKNFTSKKGKKFHAKIVLNKNLKTEFKF